MLLVLFKRNSHLDTHFLWLVACMLLSPQTHYTWYENSNDSNPLWDSSTSQVARGTGRSAPYLQVQDIFSCFWITSGLLILTWPSKIVCDLCHAASIILTSSTVLASNDFINIAFIVKQGYGARESHYLGTISPCHRLEWTTQGHLSVRYSDTSVSAQRGERLYFRLWIWHKTVLRQPVHCFCGKLCRQHQVCIPVSLSFQKI
jgi:hypothetical protein